MIYKFIDKNGTFIVKNPHIYNLYLPLTNIKGNLLSSISCNFSGDIKKDDDHFLTIPVSIEDIRSNLLCRRDFFIKTEKETIRLSFPYKDTLEIGLLYQKVIKKTQNFIIEILNFIPYDLDVEVMYINITNISKNPQKIIPTSFIPIYARSAKNLRDHRHVSSLLNRIELKDYGILVKPTMIFDEKGHKENKTIYFVYGWESEAAKFIGQFPTLDYFFGKGDILKPEAIEGKIKPVDKKLDIFDGKETSAAFRFGTKILKPNESNNYTFIFGIEEKEEKINEYFLKLNSPKKIIEKLNQTKSFWIDYLSNIEFDFEDKNYNNWLMWVKLQPTLRKLFGCSFLPHFDYGKGGRGWRDLWQDIISLLFFDSGDINELIINNFRGIRLDGSNATIITKDMNFISDRNSISRVWTDHGVWPYLALRLYINKTDDLNILLKETTYFYDHQLKRAKEINLKFSQNDFLLRTNQNKIYYGNILEHILIQNLVQFFNVEEHNYLKLENADWNDGLDMASQRGESIAFYCMYAFNLEDICNILERLKKKTKKVSLLKELFILLDRISSKKVDYSDYKDKQKILDEYFKSIENISGEKIEIEIDLLIKDLKEKANHIKELVRKNEFLKEGFFNGYYDNKGNRVEGKFKNRTKMMLQSQVFFILSMTAQKEQIKKIYKSVKKYLYDKKLNGFHLNTDFKDIYLDFGRAFAFSYGDKENGAFFNHMVILFSNALYKNNFIKEGFEVINSIYKMATKKIAKIYPNIPEYFNNQGQGLYLYLTGSASWYIYTLIDEILGIKYYFKNILIKPKLIDKNFFKSAIRFSMNFNKKKLNFYFIRTSKRSGIYNIKEIIIDGKKLQKIENEYIINQEQLKDKNNLDIQIYLN